MSLRSLAKGSVVQIDTEDRSSRVGITRDVTGTSVWFCSPSRFDTGERLSLKFRDQANNTDIQLSAVVVESESTSVEEGRLFRHATRARLEADMRVERDDPTKPTELDDPAEIACRLQVARDNWMITPDPMALRHELMQILEILAEGE